MTTLGIDNFSLRYYQWAIRDAVREVHEEYRLIKGIRGASALSAIEYLESLDKSQQVEIIQIFVRAKHSRAAAQYRESLADYEQEIHNSAQGAIVKLQSHYFSDYDTHKILSGSQKQQRINQLLEIRKKYFSTGNIEEMRQVYQEYGKKSANKRHLKTLIKNSIEPICGNIAVKESSTLWCHILPCKVGNVVTEIDIGGKSQLRYRHYIQRQRDGVEVGQIVTGISILEWMGLDSNTEWNILYESEEEVAANALAQICLHFIAAVPSLLIESV
jgi:hypothetical protein